MTKPMVTMLGLEYYGVELGGRASLSQNGQRLDAMS